MRPTTVIPDPHSEAAPALPERPDGRSGRALRLVYLWDADYPWDVRTEKVCLALTRAGHEVHIVARNRGRRPLVEDRPEGRVHRMPPWRWVGARLDRALGFPAFFSPRWLGLLDRVVREVRPHAIIARDLPLCPTAVWVGGLRRVPVVLDMAEDYPALLRAIWESGRARRLDVLVRNPGLAKGVERYCLPRVAHVLTVVEESMERVVRLGVPAERVSVVSNTPPRARAVPRSSTRYSGGPVDRPLELVYMGILEIPRGLDDLLDALPLLRASGHPVRLRVIGEGRDRALFEAHARRLGDAAADVEFLGYVDSHERALEIVASADVGVLPYRTCDHWDTTIPNKLFDYMAAGLPVVTADARPFARIVRATGAGEVFRSRDVEDLAGAIRRLFDPARRQACGEAGIRAVGERYNWEHDAAVLCAAVDRVATVEAPCAASPVS